MFFCLFYTTEYASVYITKVEVIGVTLDKRDIKVDRSTKKKRLTRSKKIIHRIHKPGKMRKIIRITYKMGLQMGT